MVYYKTMINDGQGNITVPSIKINGTLVGAPTTGGGDLFFTTPITNSIPNNIAIAQGSVYIKNGGLSVEGGSINIATEGKTLTVNGKTKTSTLECTGSITAGKIISPDSSTTLSLQTKDGDNTGAKIDLNTNSDINLWACSVPGGYQGNVHIIRGGFFQASDYRLKSNVRGIDDLTTLNLRPVQYDMNQQHHIGLIAHEVQEIIPCVVSGIKDGEKMQSVSYVELIAVLIKDVQRLNQKNIDLECRLSKLDNSTTRQLDNSLIPQIFISFFVVLINKTL
jgi:hypothetical protein